MGNCLTRDKYEYLQYEGRYIYCATCLAKIPFNDIYIMAHCANKSYVFCSRECYGFWIGDG